MKKSKLITCLSAVFVSAMALMSCSSSLKGRKNVILTVDGVPYTADQLFNDQKTPAAAEAKFNAVYKAAIRTYYLKDHPGYEDMEEIKRDTKVKIKELKATAQSNASKNGTSYATEWKKILTDNGVSSSSELNDKIEYDFQKEKFENKFYDAHYDELRNQENVPVEKRIFGEGFEDFLKNKQPYHMKHILVKIKDLGDNNTDATISKDEAKKLYDVVTSLANGTSFSQVSKSFNDDESARNNGGSLGIMSRDTSFVDDFKLGTYFYEAFYGSSTSEEETTTYHSKIAKEKLFGLGPTYDPGTAGAYATDIRETLEDPTASAGGGKEEALGVIPYEAVEKLDIKEKGGYGNYEFEDSALLKQAGVDKADFKDKFLPRNVIFNKFFNKHNIMIIAPAKIDATQLTYGTTYTTGTNIVQETTAKGCHRSEIEPNLCTYDSSYATTLDGFKTASSVAKNKDGINAIAESRLAIATGGYEGNLDNQHVLRDNEGRVILVFRSGTGGSSSNDDSGYQGIHFVVIERSPFIGTEYDSGNEEATNKYNTTLDEYYTEYYPTQPGGHHPQYDDEKHTDKKTFANYVSIDDLKNKKERADKVKTELKNCMPNLNTYIYEHLLKVSDIHFSDTPEAAAVNSTITDWIKINREDTALEKERNWDNNWQNYCYNLKAKAELRDDVLVSTNHYESRVVSQLCINAITNTNFTGTDSDKIKAVESMFGVGGVFHE